jgi:hypothetical protein
MSSSKKMTCNGTLRQVFIRVYRLEIQGVSHVGIFRPRLFNPQGADPHPLPLREGKQVEII